jgi:hypothetical protein
MAMLGISLGSSCFWGFSLDIKNANNPVISQFPIPDNMGSGRGVENSSGGGSWVLSSSLCLCLSLSSSPSMFLFILLTFCCTRA